MRANKARKRVMIQPPERAIGPGDGGTRSGDDTSEMHEPGGRKTRDIFPLPLLLEPSDGLAVGCRKTMRRKQHQRHLVEETNRTIQALNLMFCGSGDRKRHFSLDSHLFGEASAQWDSLEFIEEMVKRMGKPPPDMTCQGALSMLRAAGGYTDDQPVGSLASYDPEGISLPEPGWQPIDLAELWGANGRCMVNEFVRTKVLPPEEARVRLEECGDASGWKDLLQFFETFARFRHHRFFFAACTGEHFNFLRDQKEWATADDSGCTTFQCSFHRARSRGFVHW